MFGIQSAWTCPKPALLMVLLISHNTYFHRHIILKLLDPSFSLIPRLKDPMTASLHRLHFVLRLHRSHHHHHHHSLNSPNHNCMIVKVIVVSVVAYCCYYYYNYYCCCYYYCYYYYYYHCLFQTFTLLTSADLSETADYNNLGNFLSCFE